MARMTHKQDSLTAAQREAMVDLLEEIIECAILVLRAARGSSDAYGDALSKAAEIVGAGEKVVAASREDGK